MIEYGQIMCDFVKGYRAHSRTTTTPVFTNKWSKDKHKLNYSGSGKGMFGSYKDKLAKKYDKKKKKLKETLKEKKATLKEKKAKYKRRKKTNDMSDNEEDFLHLDDMSVTMTAQSQSRDIEYSMSTTMTNPLAPNLPPNMAINPEFTPPLPSTDGKELEEEEEEKEVIEFYTLYEIVEKVTSPEVRGTQDQTVLLHTYCLFSTRQFSFFLYFRLIEIHRNCCEYG